MSLAVAPERMTLDEFLQRSDIKERAELVLGIVYPPMEEHDLHQFIRVMFHHTLSAACPDRYVGMEMAITIERNGQPRPDIAVFRMPIQEIPRIGGFNARNVEVVVEVCVSSHRADYVRKDLQYAQGGIPGYLILDPEESVAELRTGPTPLGYSQRARLTAEDSYRGIPLADYLRDQAGA